MCTYCGDEGSQMRPVLLNSLDMGIGGELLMDVGFDADSGEALVNVMSPYADEHVTTRFQISFCPFCGRDLSARSNRRKGITIRMPGATNTQRKNKESTCRTKMTTRM